MEKFGNKKGQAETPASGAENGSARPAAKGGRRKTKGGKRWLLLVLAVLAVVGLIVFLRARRAKAAAADTGVAAKNIGTVQRGNITSKLDSSGSLSPKDTYTITSLVSGEIISADFEEGDQVEKGQVLYVIDQSDMNSQITSANRSLSSAEKDHEDAEKNLDDARRKLNNGVICATQSGYIKDISIKPGDSVNNNQSIGKLYNDLVRKLRLPFLAYEADAIGVGANLAVVISDTGEQIPGRVESKSSLTETLTGGTLVKYLDLIVANPGGLTTADAATAFTGDITSAGDGYFEPYAENEFRADLPASVKVAQVLVTEGQYVSAGGALFSITSESLNDALKSFEKSLTSSENALISAQDKIDQLSDTLDRYTITAPISGQVIKKNSKAGDKLSTSGNSGNTQMAIIYDLSELTFEMSIDELDISNIKVGQEVVVTADAFEGQRFTGHVTNVSLNGSAASGVTTYPVAVTLDEKGPLLPAMNVDGTIILAQANDVLYVPANALQRGNVVYVKDTSLTEEQKAAAEGQGRGKDGQDMAQAANAQESAAQNAQSAQGGQNRNRQTGGMPGMPGMPGGSSSSSGQTSNRSGIPDGFTAVRVETGLITDDYVEISSGLSEGQEVYVKDAVSTVTGWGNWGGMGGMNGRPGGNMGGGRR